MKRRPDRSRVAANFDPDRFIQGATAEAPPAPASPPTKPRSSRSHFPAEGTVRRSFDLPEPLYRKLKLTAAEQDRSMREIVLEALSGWIDDQRRA